jgi:hypothetical protein
MYDDFLARILEPDIFLPSQFYGTAGLSRQLYGEKRLMIAILKDAVECLNKHRGTRSTSGRSLYQNALEWVQDKSTDWLFRLTISASSWDSIPNTFGRPYSEKKTSTRNPSAPRSILFP